jgi:AcrR family transcriptional regulator
VTPPRAGLSRPVVLDVAAEIADREGLDHVSLKSIAAAVNVRPPSLYNHIEGLDDVKLGLRVRGFERLLAEERDAVAGLPVAEWLPALAHAHRRFARRHPGLYAATHPTAHRDDETDEVRQLARPGLDILLEAVSPFGLGEDDAVHAVRAFRSLVVGFNQLESAGHFGIPVGVDESFEYVVALLTAGLTNQ